MSVLKVYQSLWATELRIPGVPERSFAERFDQVKAAGFDGLSIDLGAVSFEIAEEIVPHYARTGLGGLVTAFPKTIEDLRPAIHLAKRIGAPFVIVVGQIMPLALGDMADAIDGWCALAAEESMPLQFETHRDSTTNDLFSLVQLLDIVPAMVLSGDLSHYVVDRELSFPIVPLYRELFSKLLTRCGSLQGRVATGQHIQVPLNFPQHRPWLDLFTDWWTEGFASWRARHGESEDCIFLCELGPTEYAITGADGRELSDRWQEAQQLRDIARACWAKSAQAPNRF